MTYTVELVKKEQLQTTTWSGGTTTQLAIYPKGAIYSERNFVWRLSSAQVEVERSVFTSLPGIDRVIMVIKGELILQHEGHHRSVLKPFEQDSFSGSWKTVSFGKVTDFNLMTNQGCEGELKTVHIQKDESKAFSFKNEKPGFLEETQAIYCVSGKVDVKTSQNEIFELDEGDLVLLTLNEKQGDVDFTIRNKGDGEADLIRACIRY